jgi:hypothetical protein
MTPKNVKDAKEFYNFFVDKVNQFFKVIDESVEPLSVVCSELF